MRLEFFFAVLLSCSPVMQAECRTECGARLFNSADCKGLSRAESIAIQNLKFLYPELCARMSSLSIEIMLTPDGWFYFGGQKVAGLTYCDLAWVQLASSDWSLGAYVHEMAHVAECPEQKNAHQGWAEAGIFGAIEEARKEISQKDVVR